jgi:hypothetical protein
VTVTQLLIANIFGTIAILISVMPFFFGILAELAKAVSLTDSRNNYSYYGGVFKIYMTQLLTSLFFMWFVKLWDIIVKKNEYKLEGTGHAFENWWNVNWKADMLASTEAKEGLYAYQGLIQVPFETFFSIFMILAPIFGIVVATLRTSQGNPQYKRGSKLMEISFNTVLYSIVSTALFWFYLEIIDVSLRMPTSIHVMVENYWSTLL